jgi:hypothetical protein
MLDYNPEQPLFSIHIPKTAGTSIESVLQSWFNRYRLPNLNNHPRLYKIIVRGKLDFLVQRWLGCSLYYHYRNEYYNDMPRRAPLGTRYGLFYPHAKPECVHGHFDPNTDGGDLFHYYPQAQQFITFLRDPLEMQLSLFFYMRQMINAGAMFWQGKKITADEFDDDLDRFVEERNSYMLHFLPMHLDRENFREVLGRHFIHIGVTERIQRSIDVLADKLSFPSQTVPIRNTAPRNAYPSESSVRKFREKHELEYRIYEYAVSLNN